MQVTAVISSQAGVLGLLLHSLFVGEVLAGVDCCRVPSQLQFPGPRAKDYLECKYLGLSSEYNSNALFQCGDRGLVTYSVLNNSFTMSISNGSKRAHSLTLYAECRDPSGKVVKRTEGGVRCGGIAPHSFFERANLRGLSAGCALLDSHPESLRVYSYTLSEKDVEWCQADPID